MLPGKHISGITFLNKEMHGLVLEENNVTFDLSCKEEGTEEEFLVEVQNRDQNSFRDRMLKDLYDATELGSMTIVQRQNYDNIMFTEIDRIATMDFAIQQAKEQGREEGMVNVALNLLRLNVPLETISKSTGLSEEKIMSLEK